MKLKTGHKVSLFLVLTIAAVVLCTLPFWVIKKDVIYIYTENQTPSSEENGFIRELRHSGFKVIINSLKLPDATSYGFWFKYPDNMETIENSAAKLNFIYTDAYYPLEWKNTDKHPIMLTPYRLLFEHYMRSNMKSAMMSKGVNLAEYYPVSKVKKYSILYYGDNNQNMPLKDILQNREDAKFFGAYWDKMDKVVEADENQGVTANTILSASKIVVIYNHPDSSESNKIPEEVMRATASGALVFSSPNSSISDVYKDNVIIYENPQDFQEKVNDCLKNYNLLQDKIKNAQKITIEQFSSYAMSNRFKELLNWLKDAQIKKND